MKTKIIYISGDEIFDIADIRAAFNEVRNALNLDKNTVLFGVPIDKDGADFSSQPIKQNVFTESTVATTTENVNENDSSFAMDVHEEIASDIHVFNEPEKSHIRSRKKTAVTNESPSNDTEKHVSDSDEEKIIPILSILSDKKTKTDDHQETPLDENESDKELEIIEDETNETVIESQDTVDSDTEDLDSEPDLEQLLSEIKPLQEDILDEEVLPDVNTDMDEDNENVDATLEKLATEFVQTQEKITSESKPAGRSKIGKLRNILPFKQSKHHDQSLGDLFGWAGVAANDEEFSVPGFFTTASSKK